MNRNESYEEVLLRWARQRRLRVVVLVLTALTAISVSGYALLTAAGVP